MIQGHWGSRRGFPLEPSNFMGRRSGLTMGATVDSKSRTRATKQEVMEKAVGSGTVVAAPTFENPLVPNAVLRQMYQKMVETRLLGELAVRLGRKAKTGLSVHSIHGQEACRVSV